MNYQLVKEVIELIEKFDVDVDSGSYPKDLGGFKRWIYNSENRGDDLFEQPNWEGKDKGRSPESAINTLIVHMNRYAKTYSRSVIYNSDFSTQEDFIYLITLKAFGAMTKMDLIRKNIQEKTVGMQIINRLIKQGWVQQSNSLADKRSKIIVITAEGIEALAQIMGKIRQATKIVTGNLSHSEKLQLIVLLQKLENFHESIYSKNLDLTQLIDIAYSEII